jgi:hypothetical protein
MTTIQAFNTRRLYSKHGQRIAYARLKSGNVAMVDIDRHLDYVLLHRPDFTPNHASVLRAYDANRTASYSKEEYEEAEALRAALEVAAAAL